MSVTETEIQGICEAGYEPVRDAFAENFAERNEIGASVAVVAHGEPVVNLWAGWADTARTRLWQENTLTNVWSTTKAMTALCAHLLMDRVGLDMDATVASYWPEFAAGGKGDIPLRWVMSHRSGLSGLTVPITAADLEDWEKITTLLAAQEPLWEPGTVSGYHAVTFGFLVGEVVRRVTGEHLGRFFASEIAGLLGADFEIGLAEGDLERCSEMQGVRPTDEELAARGEAYAHPAALFVTTPDGRLSRVLSGLSIDGDDVRTALKGATHGGVVAIVDQIRSLCYGLGASVGRYANPVRLMLAAAGALTLLAVAGGIGFLVRASGEGRL